MAFSAQGLSRIGHGGGQTLYMYKTTDALATVIASGYFNAIYTELRKGDIILLVDTNVPTTDMLSITSADGAATVTVQNGT